MLSEPVTVQPTGSAPVASHTRRLQVRADDPEPERRWALPAAIGQAATATSLPTLDSTLLTAFLSWA